jgi:hypothetical protein
LSEKNDAYRSRALKLFSIWNNQLVSIKGKDAREKFPLVKILKENFILKPPFEQIYGK